MAEEWEERERRTHTHTRVFIYTHTKMSYLETIAELEEHQWLFDSLLPFNGLPTLTSDARHEQHIFLHIADISWIFFSFFWGAVHCSLVWTDNKLTSRHTAGPAGTALVWRREQNTCASVIHEALALCCMWRNASRSEMELTGVKWDIIVGCLFMSSSPSKIVGGASRSCMVLNKSNLWLWWLTLTQITPRSATKTQKIIVDKLSAGL